jgi:hypothetical protein
MQDLSRLSVKAREVLNLSDNERIQHIRKKKWFGYPGAKLILDQLEDLLVYPKSVRMPNLLITGDTNNGKTSVIQEFLSRYPADDGFECETITVPVLSVEAPPVPDEARFYDEILESLYAPYKLTDKAGKKEREVIRLMKKIDVKMMIIDEIHNLLAGPMTRQTAFLNTIKRLGNKLQIPIVAVGTKDAYRAIHSDDQLSNRFKSMRLSRWDYNEDYLALLSTFEHTLALKEPSNLVGVKLSKKILTMSEGVLGEITDIITTSAVHAIRKGQESINEKTLDEIGWILPSKRKSVA